MPKLKTRLNDSSVSDFLKKKTDAVTRSQCWKLIRLMKRVTRCQLKMWATSIAGSYRYVCAGGRQGDWFLTGFSPRKRSLTI